MSEPTFERELGELERIARGAGELVMRGYRQGTRVQKKGAIDLVTEFDLASEAFITEALTRAFPGVPIVGEEAHAKRAVARGDDDALRLFVDPIDGTTNFAHGHPFFCVSLGLTRGTAPLAGVVFAPALSLMVPPLSAIGLATAMPSLSASPVAIT